MKPLFIFFGLILIILDQIIKIWATNAFLITSSTTDIRQYLVSEPWQIFLVGTPGQGSWVELSLTYVRNTGAAWGMLGNLPEVIRPWFFAGITTLGIGLLGWFFVKTRKQQYLSRFALFLVLSGAIGNFIDRLWLQYVVDWVHVQWNIFGWFYSYPVFNLADSCVTVGMILFLIDTLLPGRKTAKMDLYKSKLNTKPSC